MQSLSTDCVYSVWPQHTVCTVSGLSTPGKDCCHQSQTFQVGRLGWSGGNGGDCVYSVWPEHTWKRLPSPVTDLSGRWVGIGVVLLSADGELIHRLHLLSGLYTLDKTANRKSVQVSVAVCRKVYKWLLLCAESSEKRCTSVCCCVQKIQRKGVQVSVAVCRKLREKVYKCLLLCAERCASVCCCVQKAEGKGVQDAGSVASGDRVIVWLQQQRQHTQ